MLLLHPAPLFTFVFLLGTSSLVINAFPLPGLLNTHGEPRSHDLLHANDLRVPAALVPYLPESATIGERLSGPTFENDAEVAMMKKVEALAQRRTGTLADVHQQDQGMTKNGSQGEGDEEVENDEGASSVPTDSGIKFATQQAVSYHSPSLQVQGTSDHLSKLNLLRPILTFQEPPFTGPILVFQSNIDSTPTDSEFPSSDSPDSIYADDLDLSTDMYETLVRIRHDYLRKKGKDAHRAQQAVNRSLDRKGTAARAVAAVAIRDIKEGKKAFMIRKGKYA